MNEKRVYGDAVNIDAEHVRAFYQKRAAMNNGVSVLLGNPEAVMEKNVFERDEVIPKLSITKETRLLDIGCGIGRLAEMVLPYCGFYCGVDFSSAMIDAAEQVCRRAETPFALHTMSFSQIVQKDAGFFGGKFDAVLIPGVCAYINDAELSGAFQNLPNLLSDTCTLYLTEPVGLERRLSLVDFPSKELQTDYSAIYRTADEYMALYAPLFKAGFSVVEQRYWPRFGETYTDTGRWHVILRR